MSIQKGPLAKGTGRRVSQSVGSSSHVKRSGKGRIVKTKLRNAGSVSPGSSSSVRTGSGGKIIKSRFDRKGQSKTGGIAGTDRV